MLCFGVAYGILKYSLIFLSKDVQMEHYDWEKPEDLMAAVLTLYSAQTPQEKESQVTVELNGVGFNAVDAPIFSSFARQMLESGRVLSEKQLAVCKARLFIYSTQLGALPRSSLPPLQARPMFTPKEKYNGTLRARDGELYFVPTIYPSGQIKSLGFTWVDKIEGWKGRLSIANIEGVERLFSPIVIDPSVDAFIEQALKPIELSSTVEKSTLFEKQKEAVKFMLTFKKVLLGMSPGTGKTASSIFAANELKKYDDFLVVCPLTLVKNWQNEIRKWIGEEAAIWHGPISKWTNYSKWVITNYETFIKNVSDFSNQPFKVVIFDESVVMKNRKTLRAEKAEIYTRNMDYVFLLSGSPTTKFLDDMWSQFHVLDRKRFSSYWRFVDQYCEKEVTQWGTNIAGNQYNAIERLKTDTQDIYFSCSQEDIMDIPDWIFDTIEVPMSKTQFRFYQQMEEEFMAELPDNDVVLAKNTLSQLIRLMQFSSNPVLLGGPNDGCKWRAVEDLLEFEELPAIVWTQFIHSADMLSQRLGSKGYKVERLTGQTPQEVRQDIVDRFQSGEIDVLVAHPAVGKYGLTLTRGRTAIYMERSFNGDDFIQSLYRIKRIGTTQSPHVILLLATRPEENLGTVDHVIDRVLEFRKDSSLQITKSSLTSGLIREILGKPLKGTENGQ